MKNFKALAAVLFVSALAITGCQKAEAALPLQAGVSYVDNTVIDKEGVGVKLGTEVNNVEFGAKVFASEDKLETFGAYAGVPIQIHNTRFSVTPQVSVDRYRDLEETVGAVGLGLGFDFTPTLRLDATGMVARGFDNSDIDGEIYSVGLTKTF